MTLSQTHTGMLWRPAATPRRKAPQGLPLPAVDLAVPVWLSDIAPGRPWPPPRLEQRTDRMQTLWEAARSDLSAWANIPMPEGLWESLVDDYATILGDAPIENPGGAEEASLVSALKAGARSLLTYGHAVLFDDMGIAGAPDMRYAWPLGDRADGWVTAELLIAPDATSPTPTSIVLWIRTGGIAVARRYAWTADTTVTLQSGTLGEQLPAPPPRIGRAVGLRHGSTAGPAGEPLLEQLLPLIVRIERRDASIDYLLDRSERPIFVVEIEAHAAASVAQQLGRPVAGTDVTPQVLQSLAGDLADHDTLTLVDGLKRPQYVTWDGMLEPSFRFRGILEAAWSRRTGQAATEAADSADEASGVSVARRQARLVAHVQDVHGILERAARQLWPAFAWPWRDPLGEAAVPPSGPQPAIEAPTAQPGNV